MNVTDPLPAIIIVLAVCLCGLIVVFLGVYLGGFVGGLIVGLVGGVAVALLDIALFGTP